ncbi:MAG TPA: VIT domain-containing protein [Kofleriaceae bacterium]|nr:VIT domain-containing protein [Kofleriaceae bacterium]
MPMPLLATSTVHATDLPTSGAELYTGDGRSLPLVGARLTGQAKGGLARLVLEQRFENPYDETLRVTYRMPLPADGAVSGYEFELDDRVVKGVVDRKAAARERFEQAIAAGHTAALLEQERADVFTQELGNLPARASIVARITVDQRLVWLPEGEWELRFPTVIGPRYVSAKDATPEDARATVVSVAPGGIAARIAIEVAIGDATTRAPVSPSHALRVEGERVRLAEDGARLDRDVVLRWAVAGREVGLSLDHVRGASGDAYGLLTLVPPARAAKAAAVARDLIVLLDTSGSMGGGPLDQAKRVLALLIESLTDDDRLELVEFSTAPRRYLAEPVAATAAAKKDAIRWVRARQADGGTEMASGIREALRGLRPGAQRQVIVVTDGYIGGEQQIIALLHERLPASCRLHVLGVGSAVNRSLATAMSRAGRGVEVIADLDEDPERAAARLVRRTARPVLVDVTIGGSALVAHAPEHLPDVFDGSPLVAALALLPEGGELIVRGRLADGGYEQRIAVPARRAGEGNGAIAALYGRERVADLETRAQLGEAVDRELEGLGLRFQIATRMTSWVAVDESRTVERGGRHEVVPQELPYGTSAGSFGLRGAGGAPVAGEATDAIDGLIASPAPAMAHAQTRTRTMAGALAKSELADAKQAYRIGTGGGGASPAPSQPARPMEAPTGAIAPASPASPAKPLPAKSRRAWPLLLLLIVLLGLLAALGWWLVRG